MNKFKVILIAFVIFSGCKHDLEKPGWSVDILAPILKAELSINNLVADTLINTGSDSLVSLVLEEELINYTLSDIIPPFESKIESSVKLNTIELGDTEISESISLGEVAKNAGTIGLVIIANNGNNANIPPINDLPPSSYDIDANEFFESLTLAEGFLDLSIENGFPIPITDLIYRLKNSIDGEVIVQDTVPLIESGTSFNKSYDLANKTIEGTIEATLITFSSPGSGGTPVMIDTSDLITIDMDIRDMVLFEATAIFPEQNLVNDTTDIEFAPDSDFALTEMTVRSGQLNVQGISTIADSVSFYYKIPNVTKNGQVFEVNATVPPAPEGGSSFYNEVFDMEGYTIDLRGRNGDSSNLFYDIFIANIDSSGNLVNLSLEDSVFLSTSLVQLVPENGFGNLGTDIFSIGPDSIELSVFKSIPSGSINFQEADISIEIENGFGAAADIEIGEFTGSNSDGSSIALNGDVVNETFNLLPATLNSNPPLVSPYQGNWLLDQNNSNIVDIINIQPEKITYALDIFLNPGSNPNTDNFIYYDYGLNINLNLSIPLHFIASNLILRDTSAIGNQSGNTFDNLEQGTFKLIVKNGFPLTTELSLIFLDEMFSPIDSVVAFSDILAGIIGSNGKVEQPTTSVIEFFFDRDKIATIQNAKHLVYRANFNTVGIDPVKIYSSYAIGIQLVGDVEYNLGN